MRILLATDAWEPQVNGVVRTLTRTVAELRAMGDEVEVISPDQFPTFPLPTYPEIKLALFARRAVGRRLSSARFPTPAHRRRRPTSGFHGGAC